MTNRHQADFNLISAYFKNANVGNNYEFTQMKIIAIKRLKAKKFNLKQIQDAIGISYKNILKLNSREADSGINEVFDTFIVSKHYPIKNKSRILWKQQD